MLVRRGSEASAAVILGQEPNPSSLGGLLCDCQGKAYITCLGQIQPVRVVRESGFIAVETPKVTFISCYFPPSGTISEFEILLDSMERSMAVATKGVVIGGDLNAKTRMLGSVVENQRGRKFDEWLLRNGLVVLNEGSAPTFDGPRGTSIIDFTVASPATATMIREWRVNVSEENLSDHNTIEFMVGEVEPNAARREVGGGRFWVTEQNWQCFLLSRTRLTYNGSCSEMVGQITGICQQHFGHGSRRKPTKKGCYWWNQEIALKRAASLQERRRYLRAKRRFSIGDEAAVNARERYTAARRELKYAIRRSKLKAWNQLIEELESNPFGKAYQIVMGRMGQRTSGALPEDLEELTVRELFRVEERAVGSTGLGGGR